MKLGIVGALRDERAKQISGSRILLGFQIKAGEIASEFGVGRSFIDRLKRGDSFLRFAFGRQQLAELKLCGGILRIGRNVFVQPGFGVGKALLLEIKADEAFDALIVSGFGKFQILLLSSGCIAGALCHAGDAELSFRVCGIELSGFLIRSDRILRLAFFHDLRQREPCRQRAPAGRRL